jgi:hypothetical protein
MYADASSSRFISSIIDQRYVKKVLTTEQFNEAFLKALTLD